MLTDRRSVRSAFVVCCALLLLGAASAQAQQETFGGEVSVVLVEVPVQVIGRDGEPVRGLTAEDFELLQGDQRLEIVGFRAIDLEDDAEAAEGRHFLLFFDFANSTAAHLDRALRGARGLIAEGLVTGDRVSVGLYTPNTGARLLIPFSDDRDVISRALDVVESGLGSDPEAERQAIEALIAAAGIGDARSRFLGLVQTTGVEAALDLNLASVDMVGFEPGGIAMAGRFDPTGELAAAASTAGGPGGSPDGGGAGPMSNRTLEAVRSSEAFDLTVANEIEERKDYADDFLIALEELAVLLREVPGPKYFLLLSEGIQGGFVMDARILQKFQNFNRALLQGGWSLQAVDIAGLSSGENDSLFLMAKNSGGELIQRENQIDRALERVSNRTRASYSLAFNADGVANDGRFRTLDVKLKDAPRGTRILHPPGFYAPSPEDLERGGEQRLAAVRALLGDEERADLSASVLVTPTPALGPDDPARVSVLVEIGGAGLLEGLADETLPVEIQTYALDGEGSVVDLFSETITLDVAKAGERLRQQGLKFLGELSLPAGSYRLRVLARNTATDRAHLATVPLAVPALDAGPILYQPIFVDETGEWILAHGERIGSPSGIYSLGDQRFVPSARPAVDPGSTLTFCLMARGLEWQDLVVQARILDEDGEPLDGGQLLSMERAPASEDGLDRFRGQFRTASLDAGSYQLELLLGHRESGPRAALRSAFDVAD